MVADVHEARVAAVKQRRRSGERMDVIPPESADFRLLGQTDFGLFQARGGWLDCSGRRGRGGGAISWNVCRGWRQFLDSEATRGRTRHASTTAIWSVRMASVRTAPPTLRCASPDVCKLVCKETHMATNLAIDPELLDRALSVSGVRTKKEAVTIALREFIARREQARIVESFGTLDWDDEYDYKADRRSRDLDGEPVE